MLILGIIFTLSCQKELHFPPTTQPVVVVEQLVRAIVVADTVQNDYDSIVFRYSNTSIREVHYGLFGDSITRTYSYDAYGRLAKIEDEMALYYTNKDMAKRIRFEYNGAGQIVQTITDFRSASGVVAHFNYFNQGDNKIIVIYDTSYNGTGYDLDWADRIIYHTVSPDNYILYDSCIYIADRSAIKTTRISDYIYDDKKNAQQIIKRSYQEGIISEWGISIINDRSAPVFDALRKKLYSNLSNWYETSSFDQDDNYKPFAIPGTILKKTDYEGYSDNGGPTPQQVSQIFEFKNIYDIDLLQRCDRTGSVAGRGTIFSVKQIRYYYY